MRIWVARPEPGATRTAQRLLALGHDPLIAPVIEVEAMDESPPAGHFDALLVTSANALYSGWKWSHLHHVPVFAVGARTASLALRQGFAFVRTAGTNAMGLADLVRQDVRPGATLLHVAGKDRKAEPEASLIKAGFRIRVFESYRARPLQYLPAAVTAAFEGPRALTAMLHYSRRSAATATHLALAAGYGGAFAALRHYCLSADVAAGLMEGGITPYFVAERADEDALLTGIRQGL